MKTGKGRQGKRKEREDDTWKTGQGRRKKRKYGEDNLLARGEVGKGRSQEKGRDGLTENEKA